MKAWRNFCAERGFVDNVISSGLLAAFAAWLEAQEKAPATIERRISGVVMGQRKRLGLAAVPKGISAQAFEVVLRYRKWLGENNIQRGRGQANVLTVGHARQMYYAQPDTLMGLRNKTLLLIWFFLGSRRSEIARLTVADFVDRGEIMTVRHGWTKTGPHEPVLSRKPDGLCPVRAWHRWVEAAELTGGPAFPRMHRADRIYTPDTPCHMTGESVGKIITEAGRHADIDIHFTGHSVRAGMITEARRGGADHTTICAQSGHRPDGKAIHGYYRIIDRAQDNTTHSINF
jgi:integrase